MSAVTEALSFRPHVLDPVGPPIGVRRDGRPIFLVAGGAPTLLERAGTRRTEIRTRLDELTGTVEARGDTATFTSEEETEFRALMDEDRTLETRETELTENEQRATAAAAAAGRLIPPARITSEPVTYRKGDHKVSYFRDVYLAKHREDHEARERLVRNDNELRAIDTTSGSFGAFAPPQYMIDQFAALARPGRPVANIVSKAELPSGVSSINMPRISTGSSVALQTTQNTAVSNTDPTSANVQATVQTLAGFVVISLQDILQSPISMDDVILADLAADYARAVDALVLAGLVAAAGTVVTYTDASPTTAKVNSQLQGAIDTVHQNRYLPPDAVIMRPDRWGRFIAYTDNNGRPLVVPNPAYGPWNAFGTQETPISSQGVAGTIHGLPAILDPNIPNNLGAGTNQDYILAIRAEDSWLYEGRPAAEALEQTYGTQMSVLLRFYNFVAFTAGRYPKSIAEIVGTGMVPPAYGS